MKTIFHVLNVGHGSSVIIENHKNDTISYGVVDSNLNGKNEPRALTKLKEIGVESLSFLCLSHPHRDHFSGLMRIIEHYRDRIDTFVSYPVGHSLHKDSIFKKYVSMFSDAIKGSGSKAYREQHIELLKILMWASKSNNLEWIECDDYQRQLRLLGFENIDVHSILPPKAGKGRIYEAIKRNDRSILNTSDENDLSIALMFDCFGKRVVLGADGTAKNWDLRKKFEIRTQSNIAADVVNIPHHGSKLDAPASVLQQLFDRSMHGFASPNTAESEQYGITSANGKSHPALETLTWLRDKKILPYCTNLHSACGPTITELHRIPSIERELEYKIREISSSLELIQPCQGDITISIEDSGIITVTPENPVPCPFRPGYDGAFGGNVLSHPISEIVVN